jgi:hypothetical protein
MSVTNNFSGVVLDQNATVTGSLAWRDGLGAQTIYQTFTLAADYQMGTTTIEKRYPDLSGFQVMITVDVGYAQMATLDYTMGYYIYGEGWSPLADGTVIGAHTTGQMWFDVIFPTSVPVHTAMIGAPMRIGITARTASAGAFMQPVITNPDGTYVVNNTGFRATLTEGVPYPITLAGQQGFLLLTNGEVTFSIQQGISGLWYVSPTAQGDAFLSDAVTPLLGHETTASLDFRILGLTADHGVDFLGNEYRSCVIQQTGTGLSTTSPAWTSPPFPSRFATVSQYFDVRPQAVSPSVEYYNFVANPSFEWDANGSNVPYGWQSTTQTATARLLEVQQNWAFGGVQSLRSTIGFTGVASSFGGVQFPEFRAFPNTAFSASCMINILSLPTSGSVTLNLLWYTSLGVLAQTTQSIPMTTLGIQALSINGIVVPSSATNGTLSVTCASNGSGTFDFYIDTVQITPTQAIVPYFDGDTIGCEWLGQRGRSLSAKLSTVEPADDTIVIDGIQLDPSTPNIAFNVYFSTDDAYTSNTMTETNWEQKLWQRVPEVYIATQAQEYVFPAPIAAKYMKVEFTNLQGQSYTPGSFAQPVTYKKFPTWVADYFVAQLELPSFVVNAVNVVNDALSFAYSYYLDDINQSPAVPDPDPTSATSTLTTYFNQSNAANTVDATTLRQINLTMNSFSLPTGSIVDTSTLLGQAALSQIAQSPTPLTSERPTAVPPDYTIVSSSSREAVVFEQSLPVMYFFLTCRHTYKEVQASFGSNLAYFAGTNSISFVRHNYTTATDSVQYIESGNDTVNALRQDFDIDVNSVWYTY